MVNVQWLSDLVLGHLEALKLPVSPKYRFLGHENQFNLDLSKVLHLMGRCSKCARLYACVMCEICIEKFVIKSIQKEKIFFTVE